MTARASGEGRRNDCRVGCAQGGQGSGAEEGCFSWKGMAGGLADLAFSKRDESTEVAKTGGEKRARPRNGTHGRSPITRAQTNGGTDGHG